MDRILATGGGGFIASHLARYLYQQGCFDRAAEIKYHDYIQNEYCSEKLTLDLCVLGNCMEGTRKIDKVYNLADRFVTINELADMIIKISGKKITKNYNLTAAQGVRGSNTDLTLVKKCSTGNRKSSWNKA